MLSPSPYRRPLAGRLLAAFCAALLLAACLPAPGPSLTDAASRYQPVRIAGGVPSRPGAAAWSPDGRQLAFIQHKAVTIADLDGNSPALRHIDIPSPRFLAWADDGSLYVLSGGEQEDALFRVGPGRSGMTRTALERRADAVYPDGRGGAFLLSLQTSRLKIGTEVRCELSLLPPASGTAAVLHGYSRIIPAAERDEDLLTAWVHAGPNPLDGSFLLMEHINPPALPPYTLVRALDPASGDLADLAGDDRQTVYVSASWSPDGTKIALTDRSGRLAVRGPSGIAVFNIADAGRFPSWHPGGSLLAAGGVLIDRSTGALTPLLANAGSSWGAWSPDGSRLAQAAQGELMVFGNFTPARAPLDLHAKKKLTALRALLGDGLITVEDYRERRSRLLRDKEGGPR